MEEAFTQRWVEAEKYFFRKKQASNCDECDFYAIDGDHCPTNRNTQKVSVTIPTASPKKSQTSQP